MLRRIFRLSLLVTLPALGCKPPPAGEPVPPTDAADATAPADDATADGASADAALPEAEQVLAKSIEALGGADAIAAIASSYTESKTDIKAQNISMATKIWTQGTNFYVESDIPGMGLTQLWKKGDEIWSKDPIGGLRKLEGKEAAQARWSSDPLLAAHWNQYFDKAETVGRTEDGDRTIIEVQLTTADGEQTLGLLFDESTSLPAGQKFVQETQMGPMPIDIALEDYREVSGVMTSFRSVTSMQLMSMVQTTEKYEVNVEVEAAKFEPPAQ